MDPALLPKNIPHGCVLGINYSGMHDSAIALVAPDGEPLFAVSLERLTRVKQDGRLPRQLLAAMPWDRISRAAISVSRQLDIQTPRLSKTHPLAFSTSVDNDASHDASFFDIEKIIPCELHYLPHHICHAASAFWGSGFDDALCLVYDGGMLNEASFGGLYRGEKGKTIELLDAFYASHFANVAQLYSAVTAILGFTPVKHEGKITGLAAYSIPNPKCARVLNDWLTRPGELHGLMQWKNLYSEEHVPRVVFDKRKKDRLCFLAREFSREEMAATVQSIAEAHLLAILEKSRSQGWASKRICLAGGLFANVKVNQRIAESGFDSVFVAPPMSDDGTALGAAWHLLSKSSGFARKRLRSIFLGPAFAPELSARLVADLGIDVVRTAEPARAIAQQLASGRIVALFQGACEFGPRALGNRSIVASAAEERVNQDLNARLGRTEFMPFAPVVRVADAGACFVIKKGVRASCKFMTMTVSCRDSLASSSKAVVHVDNTARPQIVAESDSPLLFGILTTYQQLTGQSVLVNTSFNVHEEPIVCSPEDALRGFFESGLDTLYMEGVGLIERERNLAVENTYLRKKLLSSRFGARLEATDDHTSVAPIAFDYPVFFTSPTCTAYLAEGFHQLESWGVWSHGRYSRLIFSVDRRDLEHFELHVTILLKVYDGVVASAPVLKISMDDNEVGFVLFREPAAHLRKIDFYRPMVRDSCELQFELSASDTPSLDGKSADPRELGFALCGIGAVVLPAKSREAADQRSNTQPDFWI